MEDLIKYMNAYFEIAKFQKKKHNALRERLPEIPGGRGCQKPNFFEGKCYAKLEFWDGWEG